MRICHYSFRNNSSSWDIALQTENIGCLSKTHACGDRGQLQAFTRHTHHLLALLLLLFCSWNWLQTCPRGWPFVVGNLSVSTSPGMGVQAGRHTFSCSSGSGVYKTSTVLTRLTLPSSCSLSFRRMNSDCWVFSIPALYVMMTVTNTVAPALSYLSARSVTNSEDLLEVSLTSSTRYALSVGGAGGTPEQERRLLLSLACPPNTHCGVVGFLR